MSTEDWSVALSEAVDRLEELGLKVAHVRYPEWALMIAEAVNLAAKEVDEDFYRLKAGCIRAAIELGCEGGWAGDVFYLYHPGAGVACFHDPFGEIDCEGYWPHKWSGIPRQWDSWEILQNYSVRRLFAEATRPDGAISLTPRGVRRCLERLTGEQV